MKIMVQPKSFVTKEVYLLTYCYFFSATCGGEKLLFKFRQWHLCHRRRGLRGLLLSFRPVQLSRHSICLIPPLGFSTLTASTDLPSCHHLKDGLLTSSQRNYKYRAYIYHSLFFVCAFRFPRKKLLIAFYPPTDKKYRRIQSRIIFIMVI